VVVDLGSLLGAHQAALALPLLKRTREENKMKNSWVEIKIV